VAWDALPESVALTGEFEALLRKESVVEMLPAVEGVNTTLNDTLFPAAMVAGKVIPVRERPWPLQSAEVTVTLAFPAVRVPGNDLLLPTGTLPKLIEVGESVSCAPDDVGGGGGAALELFPIEQPASRRAANSANIRKHTRYINSVPNRNYYPGVIDCFLETEHAWSPTKWPTTNPVPW